MPNIPQGKKISAATANDEIAAFLDMMKPTRPIVVDFLEEKMRTKDLLPPIKNSPTATPVSYFRKDVNAFVFDKELVTRFFETNGPNGIQKPADVLLVFLGMVKDDNNDETNIGTPTVVLAGCHQQDDGTFKSMDLPGQEASEYPPKKIVPLFPESINSKLNVMSLDKEMVDDLKSEITKHLPLRFKIEQ